MSEGLFDVAGRGVVLTGACGLIGRHVARAFVDRGARIVLADVAAAAPERFAADLGAQAAGSACDVSNARDVAALLERATDHLGRIDVLVNAHQAKPKGFLTATPEDFPEELWDEIVDVNLKGTFLMCRDFGRAMLRQGRGSIINFASTYGVVSSDPSLYESNSLGNPVAYSASKGGVVMLTKYLGAYWGHRGVRVNCVTPHGVEDRHEEAFKKRFAARSPMGRLMRPDEVIGAVIFLASDASSYATGTNVLVEGGWTAW